MPAKEIKELRQSGRLEEALAMAQEELNAQPDNIWGKRNISWVYYEYIKLNVAEENFEVFFENVLKIKELNLSEDEVMIFDTSAWQIASMIFKLQNQESVDYGKINDVFDVIRDYHFTKPSESYSLLYKAFHKGYQNWSRFIEFADWWNFNNFRKEDYDTTVYNERETMALADQAYIAYSKKLLEGQPSDAFGITREVDQDKIRDFMPKLDRLIEDHPEYQYPSYFKAKLLLALGDKENVLSAFLPFAKQKRNDFWVWDLMAEIFNNDKELQMACYCKALSLKARRDFLIKTKLKLARILIDKEFFNEAKTEIVEVIRVREEKGWRIPNDITQWLENDWYKNAEEKSNNKILYRKHLSNAEAILYRDLPEHIVAVEFVNENKNILNFVKDKSFHGFLNYDGFIKNPQIGDVLKVRLEPIGNEGFYRLLTSEAIMKFSTDTLPSLKNVEGLIDIPEGKNFGFVDNVFIPPSLLQNNKIMAGDNVRAKAILSFNKSKKDWGWKCYELSL